MTSRGGAAVWEGKALKGEPHGCLSGEKNRQGAARSKPSRGGGTLKAERLRGCKPAVDGPSESLGRREKGLVVLMAL